MKERREKKQETETEDKDKEMKGRWTWKMLRAILEKQKGVEGDKGQTLGKG